MKKNRNTVKDDSNLMVKSRNELVNSRLNMSQMELDLFFYLLSLVRDDSLSYSFSAQELSLISGKLLQSAQVFSTCKLLMSRHIVLFDSEDRWEVINLFESISYERGVISIVITSKASRLFADSRVCYTLFELHSALALNSKYSKRLYWLLNMWRSRGSKSYTPDELRDLLSVREYDTRNVCVCDSYPDNGQLKRRCDLWCQEISEKTDITVTSQWLKKGRIYVSILFTVVPKRKSKQDALLSYVDEAERNRSVKEYVEHGLTQTQADKLWALGCRASEFREVVREVEEGIRKGKIQVWNPAAYLVNALKGSGYDLGESVDVAALEEQRRAERFRVEREAQLEALRRAAAIGVDIEKMKETMEQYGISRDEILSVLG